MSTLPVVARELLIQSRHKHTYRVRAGAALVALGAMFWLLVISASNIPPAAQGAMIFDTLASLSLFYTLFTGAAVTADCLSAEKREGTLGLLFLTDLKGRDIVLGKVAASSLLALSALLGIVPVLALALLLGGISAVTVGLSAVILLNTMFLSLSAGALVSALSTNERRAMMGAFVLMLAITALPFAPAVFVGGWTSPAHLPEIFSASPFYIFRLAEKAAPPGTEPLIAGGLLFQHVLAWTFICLAGLILRRSINATPARWLEGARRFVARHVYGAAETRKRHRRQLLDQNAFLWLGARERIKPRYAWGILGFFMAFWGVIRAVYPDMALDLPLLVIVILLAHFTFKSWLCSEVSSRLIEDRRSGALELLLTTPLQVRTIARGQSLALARIFRGPILVLVCWELVLFWMAARAPRQSAADAELQIGFVVAAGTLLADLWALKWVALWSSLFERSIERVMLKTAGKVILLPTAAFAAVMTASWLFASAVQGQFNTASVLLLWGAINLGFAIALGWPARARFLRHFREIASGRFDAPADSGSGGEETGTGRPPEPSGVLGGLAGRVPAPLRRHWVMSGLAAALLLLTAGALIRQWHWQRKVAATIAEIRARGEPVTTMDVDRYYPPAAPSKDAMQVLARAGMPAMRGSVSVMKKEVIEPDDRLLALLTNNLRQVAAFHEAAKMPSAYIAPQFGIPGFATVNVHGSAAAARAEMLVALHRNDVPGVCRSIDSFLRFTRLLRRVPLPEGQWMSLSLVELLAPALEAALDRSKLPDGALAVIDRQLRDADDPEVLSRMLAVVRCGVLAQPSLNVLMRGTPPIAVAMIDGYERVTGNHDKEMHRFLHLSTQLVEAARQPPGERLRASEELALESAVPGRILRWNPAFMMMGAGAYSSYFTQDALFQTRLTVLRAAVAAERYRLRHGRFPKSVEDIVPEYLGEIPVDLFSAEPLRTRHSDEEFAIYSVGVNRTDDGGWMDDVYKGDIIARLRVK